MANCRKCSHRLEDHDENGNCTICRDGCSSGSGSNVTHTCTCNHPKGDHVSAQNRYGAGYCLICTNCEEYVPK
jgi:hypothetical protein